MIDFVIQAVCWIWLNPVNASLNKLKSTSEIKEIIPICLMKGELLYKSMLYSEWYVSYLLNESGLTTTFKEKLP
jgi:hypothetical protein